MEVWLSNPKNEQFFYDFIKINTSVNISKEHYDLKAVKRNITKRINTGNRRFVSRFKYAGVVAVFLIAVYIFKDTLFNFSASNLNQEPLIVNSIIMPGSDKAVLTLEDGTNVELNKGETYKNKNVNSNGEQLVYKNQKKSSVVKYNYITVPRGGQFYVVLSDGTSVWLNSDSQLKYPINFIPDKTREVELVYGEAYIDVSPSSEHRGANFKVVTKSQEIDVLGTEFNIKAYGDEDSVYTTLVEGKVALRVNGEKYILNPNQQSELNLNAKSISFSEVDVFDETSWKDGIFSFDGENMENIMKVLSRWYDVEFVFKDESVKEKEFVGVIRKNKNLENILLNIKNFGVVGDFIIKENIVILK